MSQEKLSGAEAQQKTLLPRVQLLGLRGLFRPWFIALLITLIFCGILYGRFPGNFESYQTHIPEDFGSYLQAWNRLLQGENPYFSDGPNSFRYSPAFLAIIGILPKLPQDAWFAFSSLSIAGLALAMMVGARYKTWREVWYLLIGITLSWKGVMECLAHGQTELIVIMLMVLATTAFIRHSIWSGGIVGMLPWLKVPLLFMLIPFVLAASRWVPDQAGKPPSRRLKLFFSGFLLSSVFWGAGVPSLVFGPEKALRLAQLWFISMREQPSLIFGSVYNQNIWVTIDRLLVAYPMAAYGIAAMVGGLLMGFLVLRRPHVPASQDSFVWLTPWLVMSQIVNPLSFRWGSAFLIGTGFAAFRKGRQFWWLRSILWIAVIGTFLIQQNFFVRSVLGISHWTELHDYGVITAYWVLILLLTL